MSFEKINGYTWVLGDGTKTIEERCKLIDEQSLCKSENFLKEKKYRRPLDQNNVYRKFCREIFQERKFISRAEFNREILKKFNSNTSFYRRRMLSLKYITEKNKLIKPTEELFKSEIQLQP